jgi:cardiolipin synthase
MICDDWARIGSANFDTLSLRINRELDIAISGRKEVQRVAEVIFQRDFRRSNELTPEMLDGGLGLAKLVGDQL